MKGWICKYEIVRVKNLGWAVQDEMSRDEMDRRQKTMSWIMHKWIMNLLCFTKVQILSQSEATMCFWRFKTTTEAAEKTMLSGAN